MKKIEKFLLIVLVILVIFPKNVKAEETTTKDVVVTSEAAVLMDERTGTVLYSKNMDEKLYPASITKVLTVYLALDRLDPDKLLTVSKEAVDNIDRTSSHISLDYDEEVKVIDLAYAAIMMSANDAANVLAEGVAGSQEEFIKLMNNTVVSWGCKNTHFTNAHGLPDENHYTTAYDMAIITRMALKNDLFKEVFGQLRYDTEPTNKLAEARIFSTGCKLLKNTPYQYSLATGGKIGWTEPAKYTMTAVAEKDDLSLISVVLKANNEDDRYHSAINLFDYGFNNYQTVRIDQTTIETKEVELKRQGKVVFQELNDLYILLPKSKDAQTISTAITIENEESIEDIQGYVQVKLADQVIGKIAMNKQVELYDLSFQATYGKMIGLLFNYFCLAVLGVFIAVKLFLIIEKKIKAPN